MRRLDWDAIDLVVFDVDGTLYDQRRLRLAMLRQLLAHSWRTRSLDALRTLRTFRDVREELGNVPDVSFVEAQYARTASRHDKTPEEVQRLADEWIGRRPLPLLPACCYPGVKELFAALRARGKHIAVFSDYPALDKLGALGLRADSVVCATDVNIGRLKPDPAGLLEILRMSGAAPERAVMIGDRADRDGAAARAAGVNALLLASRSHPEFDTFRSYADPVFKPLLRSSSAAPQAA